MFQGQANAKNYWSDPGLRAAYLIYFSTLNHIRAQYVVQEATRLGFLNGTKGLLDVGCGSAVALLTFAEKFKSQFHFGAWDLRSEALEEAEFWGRGYSTPVMVFEFVNQQDLTRFDTFLFSYSLNEIGSLPPAAKQASKLIFIEPSTQLASRNLMSLRNDLISQGWSIKAPCTHQKPCPLLTHSVKDWCHHRIDFDQPSWFERLEENLPIKNKNLTLSYLLADRFPEIQKSEMVRVIGDLMVEKGKSKILVCRGENREFLSAQTKDISELSVSRGSVVILKSSIPKSNEIRITNLVDLEYIYQE